MDFSKFKTPDWLIVGGGLVFLIGGFLAWRTAEAGGISDSGDNVFNFFFTGIIPWILIVGSAVVTVLLIGGQIKSGSLPWPLIILGATALGTLLVLIRFISPGMGEDIPDGFDIEIGRGIGLILCTLAGIVTTVGAVLNFTSKGGSFNDLTDVNKLKSSFNQGQGGPAGGPPPPPPPMSPPPPPPAP